MPRRDRRPDWADLRDRVEELSADGGEQARPPGLAFETREGDLVDAAGEPIDAGVDRVIFVAPWELQERWVDAPDGGEWLPDGAPILE